VDDEIDGRSDIGGQHSNIEALDYLLSEMSESTLNNADATLVLTGVSADKVGLVSTGRSNTICLPNPDQKASYLELSGAAVTTAAAQAENIRRTILDACQCVLLDPKDVPGMGQGKESMEAIYRPMLQRCDRLRAQWSVGIKRIVSLMVELTRVAQTNVPLKTGDWLDDVEIPWGPYFTPTQEEKSDLALFATQLTAFLSKKTILTRIIIPLIGEVDVEEELGELEEEAAKAAEKAAALAAPKNGQEGTQEPQEAEEDDDEGEDAGEGVRASGGAKSGETRNVKDRLATYSPERDDLGAALLKKVTFKVLGKLLGFTVRVVKGGEMRNLVDVDFMSGGNPGRYAYVPLKEFWVEDHLKAGDLAAVLVHEATECQAMMQEGLEYEVAHDLASKAEQKLRKAIASGKVKVTNPIQTAADWLV
jgi:hypothetical protein